eukprot:jgi/Botrbrau1/16983/Bobra.49_2s0043.2
MKEGVRSRYTELVQLAEKMQMGIEIKDRVYRLKTYRNCFIGHEAIDWLVSQGHSVDSASAVRLGQQMVQAGLVHHVTDDHSLENKYLFYRFRLPMHSPGGPMARDHIGSPRGTGAFPQSRSDAPEGTTPLRHGGSEVRKDAHPVPQPSGPVQQHPNTLPKSSSPVQQARRPPQRDSGDVPQICDPVLQTSGQLENYTPAMVNALLRLHDVIRAARERRQSSEQVEGVANVQAKAGLLEESWLSALHALSDGFASQVRRIDRMQGDLEDCLAKTRLVLWTQLLACLGLAFVLPIIFSFRMYSAFHLTPEWFACVAAVMAPCAIYATVFWGKSGARRRVEIGGQVGQTPGLLKEEQWQAMDPAAPLSRGREPKEVGEGGIRAVKTGKGARSFRSKSSRVSVQREAPFARNLPGGAKSEAEMLVQSGEGSNRGPRRHSAAGGPHASPTPPSGMGGTSPTSKPPLQEDFIDWPDRPLLLRWHPVHVNYRRREGFREGRLRINAAEPIPFESELFAGQAVLWAKGIPSAPGGLFEGLKRKTCLIIQGRFKSRISFNQLLTGQQFDRPLSNLPSPWLLKGLIAAARALSPAL